MIEFDCSQCGKKLKVGDDAAGKRGKCPQCGALLRVPETERPTPVRNVDMQMETVLRELVGIERFCCDHFGPSKLRVSPDAYHVKSRWFDPDATRSQIPFSGSNGVYMYVSRAGEIWYIGKGCRANGGGIGKEACHNKLGTPTRDDPAPVMFGDHRFDRAALDEDIQEALTQGNFYIRTIAIEPDYLCSFVEVLLQTMCYRGDGKLPPLNKKFG